MNSKKHVLWIYGHPVEVNESIYNVVIQSERKMRYFESDLKIERAVIRPDGTIKCVCPSREDSFERLLEEEKIQFTDGSDAIEDTIIRKEELLQLRIALDSLPNDQKKLLYLRYWNNMTQSQVAEFIGTSQQNISYQERKILSKLKQLLK